VEAEAKYRIDDQIGLVLQVAIELVCVDKSGIKVFALLEETLIDIFVRLFGIVDRGAVAKVGEMACCD
jgi:hypothetical protein